MVLRIFDCAVCIIAVLDLLAHPNLFTHDLKRPDFTLFGQISVLCRCSLLINPLKHNGNYSGLTVYHASVKFARVRVISLISVFRTFYL